jgi:hypothetical protein
MSENTTSTDTTNEEEEEVAAEQQPQADGILIPLPLQTITTLTIPTICSMLVSDSTLVDPPTTVGLCFALAALLEPTPHRRLHRTLVDEVVKPILESFCNYRRLPSRSAVAAIYRVALMVPLLFNNSFAETLLAYLQLILTTDPEDDDTTDNNNNDSLPSTTTRTTTPRLTKSQLANLACDLLCLSEVLARHGVLSSLSIPKMTVVCHSICSLAFDRFPDHSGRIVFLGAALITHFPEEALLVLLSNASLQRLTDAIMLLQPSFGYCFESTFFAQYRRSLSAATGRRLSGGQQLSYLDTYNDRSVSGDITFVFLGVPFRAHRLFVSTACPKLLVHTSRSAHTDDDDDTEEVQLDFDRTFLTEADTNRFLKAFEVLLQSCYHGFDPCVRSEIVAANTTSFSIRDMLALARLAVYFDVPAIAHQMELSVANKIDVQATRLTITAASEDDVSSLLTFVTSSNNRPRFPYLELRCQKFIFSQLHNFVNLATEKETPHYKIMERAFYQIDLE